MNRAKINGILRKGGKKYNQGHLYLLDVARKSGTVDTIMVFSDNEDLPEGPVHVEGQLKAEYIHGMGVPAFIKEEKVEPAEADGSSETTVTGTLKANPKARSTHGGKSIATVLIRTEDGTVPVLLWGGNATKAEKSLKAGDAIRATGRMQSRKFKDKKTGDERTTYELSAGTMEIMTEPEETPDESV